MTQTFGDNRRQQERFRMNQVIFMMETETCRELAARQEFVAMHFREFEITANYVGSSCVTMAVAMDLT